MNDFAESRKKQQIKCNKYSSNIDENSDAI